MSITTEELNSIYRELDLRTQAILGHLCSKRIFECGCGFFSGHFYRNSKGEFVMSYFPIPVISIKNLCDIEINLDSASASTKLKKPDALKFDYEKLSGFKFEIYGVENYLDDIFRSDELPISEIVQSIKKCGEKEIGFSFEFPQSFSPEDFYGFALFLRKNAFYY